MTRPTPRRPSRTTTPKPRKIAGRTDSAPSSDDSAPSAPAAPPTPATPASSTPPTPPRPPKPPARPAGGSGGAGAGGVGLTSTLLAVLGLLVLLLIAQCGWFVWNNLRDEKEPASVTASGEEGESGEPITVPSGRPVVLDQLAAQEGVEAANAAAEAMFARSWKSYDEGVAAALELMTEEFAVEYQGTTDDVRQEFIAQKTEVQVRVVAQSVVRANSTELEALLFLNQYTFKGAGNDSATTYTPYRVVLTMVHTDRGWLVDGLQTK